MDDPDNEGETPEQNVKETPPDYDPLLQQANRLPNFLKGTDGDPSKHVRSADDDDGDEEVIDDPFGYEPPDPSKFTGD